MSGMRDVLKSSLVLPKRAVDYSAASEQFDESHFQLAPIFRADEPGRFSCRLIHLVRRGGVVAPLGKRKQALLGMIISRRRPGIFRILFKQRWCGFGSRAPNILHEGGALLPQNALNAANGVAFAVKQMADTAQQIDIV